MNLPNQERGKGAIVFAGGKLEVVAVDVDANGQEKSRITLPRVRNVEELREALAQYTAWLFQNHLQIAVGAVESSPDESAE